jgi:hypothetical protein
MISDGAGLIELVGGDVELLDEELGPSNKHIRKLKCLLERQKRRERLDARDAKADFDADNF